MYDHTEVSGMKRPVKIYLVLLTLLALLLAGCASGQDSPPAETPSPTPEVPPTVRINELMPSNKSTLADGDTFPDWIELYNYGGEPALLSGCTLSAGGKSCTLPELEIRPGAYAVIFCGGEDVPFSLPKAGAEVRILSAGGTEIDSVSYENAESDVSLCRDGDGVAAAEYPTPGFENSADGFAAFQASRECSSPLVINEAMVYNEWYRSDDGGLYDWVELKNVSAQELRLSDYYLSDDGKDRAMYRLPDETLAPGGIYVVYCTGSGDASGSYAPFALNAQSDSLYLSSADGRLCDYTPLRGIKYGGSYGRMSGENGFFYFASATIGADNAGGARCIAAEPVPSIEPGVYDGVEGMSLELSAGGTIYYTIDGSTPSESSQVYSAPIPLDATTVVRAINVEAGKLTSGSADLSYIVNEEHTLPVASLVADPDDLFGSSGGIYSNPSLREERMGSIALFDGEDGFSLDCGIKIHGATSRFAQRKKSMKLSFRSRYDGELNYDLFENGVTTFSSVLLRAAQEDTFSTHMRDVFMHQLAIKCFPTLLAQDYKYTVLYINGEYWGVYAFREAHSADSYANHYGYDADTVTQYKEAWAADSATAELFNFMRYNRVSDNDENYAYISSHIDVDSLIGWTIIQAYCGNMDDNPPNFRMYYSTQDDMSRYALVDLDLGLFKLSNSYDIALYSGYAYSLFPRTLLANAQFRERFLTTLSECLTGEMSNDSANALIDELADELRPEMARECARWGYTVELWERMVDYLHEYINSYGGRARYMAVSLRDYISISDEEWDSYFGSIPKG